MKTKPISREWPCTRCGTVNDRAFSELCLNLLAGLTGIVICGKCGQTDQVVYRNSTLELVVSGD